MLAVIAFHEQLRWAPGGLLGVGVFFTLSGYLITDLLLGQWTARGRVALRRFLGPARPTAAAGPVRDGRRDHGLGDAVRPDPADELARRDAAAATYSSNWL